VKGGVRGKYATRFQAELSVTTIDALIAAIALEHGATLFTLDKDFSRLAGITRLSLYVF